MTGSVNKVFLIGNLGDVPKIKTGRSGKKLAQLSVATSRRWTDKDSGDKKEQTQWHRVVVFHNEIAGMLEAKAKKGSTVIVDGELQTRSFRDIETDKDVYITEIVVSGFGTSTVQIVSPDHIGQGDSRHNAPDPSGPEDYGSKPRSAAFGARQPAEKHNSEVPF